MSDEPEVQVPDHVDLLDVSGQSLAQLIQEGSPELATQIAQLVALLGSPREGTLAGWNNFLDLREDTA